MFNALQYRQISCVIENRVGYRSEKPPKLLYDESPVGYRYIHDDFISFV